MQQKITIVLPEILGTVAPEIYGHFSEHIGGVFYDGLWVGKDSEIPNIRGFRKDLIEKLRKIHPPVLRWPGGCFAETYSWRDGIGENRPVRPGWWRNYDGRFESNAVGTHEFVDLCELIGAKPYFAVNVTSMTPMDARDWVDYCTSPRGTTTLALEREKNGHPEPFEIPYWGIGNENWGGGGNMTPESYAMEYRRYASVVGNILPKGAQLIAGGADSIHYDWTMGLTENLEHASVPVDGMSFHYYCGASGDCVNYTVEDWYRLIAAADKMKELIERHYAGLRLHGLTDKVKLVIDEWGCWHPDGSGPSKGYNLFEQQSTMRDAVIAALTLNHFNNHCEMIKMANAAQLCNNLHACFLAGGEHCIVTPTYHVFDLYKGHQGGQAIRTLTEKTDLRSALSASASVKAGKLTLTVANLSCEEACAVEPELLGGAFTSGNLTLLTAPDMRAHNTFEAPEAVKPASPVPYAGGAFELPPASVALLELELA